MQDCAIFETFRMRKLRALLQSCVSLLLSHREGANRAIYEACLRHTHNCVPDQCGVNLDHVNAATGCWPARTNWPTPSSVFSIILKLSNRALGRWKCGYANANKKINCALREIAGERGLPWTEDIAAKKSAPNLRYAEAGRYKQFESEYKVCGRTCCR